MVCSPHKINKMYWYNCMQHKYYEYKIKCKLSVESNYDVKHELKVHHKELKNMAVFTPPKLL